MTRRPTFLLSAAVLLSLCSLASAQQVDAPSGWTFTQQGSNWIYKPAKPPAGATFLLTVAPPQALDGKNLEAWLKSHVESDAANRGTLEDEKVQNAMLGLRAIERSYRDSKRHHWLVTYLAFPLSENPRPESTSMRAGRSAERPLGMRARTRRWRSDICIRRRTRQNVQSE